MVYVSTRSTTLWMLLLLLQNLVTIKSFEVYWNIPTFMCNQFGFEFSSVNRTYSVVQNRNDTFRGNAVSILYDPGKFPALLEKPSTKTLYKRNGGVPQEGNLTEHLEIFERHLDELIPDRNFSGIGIIDFESWRPIYRQNFGSLQPYKDLSVKIERERHPYWSGNHLEREATRRFEATGREFMEQTLLLAKQRRPQAAWGYYAFPYCFNMNGAASTRSENCSPEVQRENNRIMWLFDGSDIIFPSVYLREKLSPSEREQLIRGRVREAVRVAQRSKPRRKVLTYLRYVYTDSIQYLTESDWINALAAMKSTGSDGIILWGSSFDLNTRQKCSSFKAYLDSTLGPVLSTLQPRYIVKNIPDTST
uniref:hyaluronidase Tab y 2.0101-like n=1 Tax=Anopheles coluzzii TaxID=1518534 RepID=UPI0020FFA6BC|nr:hyaluronidase Tab y 2.0101-like [Anopheles coluzzii]XP_040236477.2 hyaluronidase Tab y 2.0101-like [Anopheles coluzzii]XP_040236478.2 hyaluronidase Tab y 2.0101-like [Anopheles coluzzii]XP_040236480.2 hyaluronidase Tab y 2.0101-like [Anopheles coluzzii]XP_040236481.2 hyaluronidase Tab y 2.0101-like [Anopheles coluzzii]XP_040236482.2 hyaluronidase Tab y 2.0101-like [Anopheles coluzzii]XP_040236483.2 hyaluronidase Tab y 2.0101-like [Anopheles coluzzii]XP_040236484.2 hyaluronidase Tab y 2.01